MDSRILGHLLMAFYANWFILTAMTRRLIIFCMDGMILKVKV